MAGPEDPGLPDDALEALRALSRGDRATEARLLPRLYEELHALAAAALRRERPGHTLEPTALVHEAWLRLARQERLDWSNRPQLFALAARTLRRVLVDHARAREAEKRGGAARRITLDDTLGAADERELDLLALDEALDALGARDPRAARVVELRFFAGLSVDETAEALGISPRTVDGDWSLARAFLARALGGGR
jgi:RNA polymerase sigma factor (TIGR02999 family)